MKKILVAVLAAAVAAASMSAEGRFVVGAKGMFQLNVGTVLSDDVPDDFSQKVLPGGGGGIFARVNVFKGLGIQLETLFTGNNGVKAEWGEDGYTCTSTYSYVALDIPLLVTWDFNLGPVILTPFLGPNFSIPLGDVKVKNEFAGESDEDDISVSSHFIPGIAFGLAAGFPVGPGAVVTELRYLHDFTPLSVGDYDADIATRGALDISVGWQFMF